MASDQNANAAAKPTSNTAAPAAPKGLLGMFGGMITPPKNPSTNSILKPIETQRNQNRSTTIDGDKSATLQRPAAGGGSGGGAWKKTNTRSERRRAGQSLVSLAQRPGRVVTVAASAEDADACDTDDVTMGGMGKKKNRRKRFSPYNAQARARLQKQAESNTQPKERMDILISGYIPGSEPNVIAYLQQKSKKTWEPVDIKVDQGQMLLTVDGATIANAIVRLNGYVFGNGPLQIQWYSATQGSITVPPPSDKKPTTMDLIRDFLRSRWNGEAQLLNLENMAADPILKRHAIRPPGDSRANEFVGPAMMKLAGEMFPNTVSISFARNCLKNVQPISTMTQFLPNIQNLSLEENRITSLAVLDAISGPGKFKHLRELILHGNPACENERKQGQERGYIKNVVKRFPSIVLLDGKPVDISSQEAQSLKNKQKMPVLTKVTFFDNERSQTITYDFLTKFLHLFDTNRPALVAIYDQSATFSVCTLLTLSKPTAGKVRGRRKQKLMDEDDAAVSWTDLSRNLKKGKGAKKTGKRISIGAETIVTALQRLPTTMHDLSRSEDFVLDAFQQSAEQANLLQISLHGEFRSGNDETLYSFDRNMLIREALPDSSAAALGVPYQIVSDMLCVRDYCSMLNRIGTD